MNIDSLPLARVGHDFLFKRSVTPLQPQHRFIPEFFVFDGIEQSAWIMKRCYITAISQTSYQFSNGNVTQVNVESPME